MKFPVFAVTNILILLSGCSDHNTSYPSAEGEPKPYILKEGCTFSIVKEHASASVDSPKVSGAIDVTASSSVSLGDISISVSDCMVVDNPKGLSIYQDQ